MKRKREDEVDQVDEDVLREERSSDDRNVAQIGNDDALEGGSRRQPGIGLADRAVRPVIRKEREGNAAQIFRPALQAGNGVGADLQDFDIQLLEFFVVRTEPGDLILSPPRESERKERHYRGATAKTAEADLLVRM